MKKSIYSAILAVFTISVFSITAMAAPGDLFVVVDLEDDNEDTACSILRVNPQGNISEFITNSQILAASGEEEAECDNVGIACAINGEFYFGEDFGETPVNNGSKILQGGPESGQVSLFTTGTQIADVTGDEANLSKGAVLGPNGNLYVNERTSNSILRITVPGSVVSIVVTEDMIADAVNNTVDLEGGIAVDSDLNIYLVDSDSDDVVSCRPNGPCTVLTTQEQLEAAAGVGDVELDEPILLVGDNLYVAEDQGCSCIFVIDINTGIPEVFLSETQIENALGGGNSDPEGGLAVDRDGRIYIGNDDSAVLGSSILRTGPNANANQLVEFVTSAQVAAVYNQFDNAEFDAGMCIIPQPLVTTEIPTLSEWSMIAMAGVLGVIGLLFAMRRRALSS